MTDIQLTSQLPTPPHPERKPVPCALVIFGASGDLAHRKLMPALYALSSEGFLPDGFTIIGAARTEWSTDEFRSLMHDSVEQFSRVPFDETTWAKFAEGLQYIQVDFSSAQAFDKLKALLDTVDKQRGTLGNRIYYLSIPPSAIGTVASHLRNAGMSQHPSADGFCRIIIEKPFGRNLQTAQELNAQLHENFNESQIYRIDHYLGKETVQNLMVFRFANGIFEPIWNRQYIDHVQMTVAESIGIEARGKYYEEAGALRDIVQNHMMQLLANVAMEAPTNFGAETVRDEKVKLLRSVRPIHSNDVLQHTIRGQYASGWVDGQHVNGYREEADVNPQSLRETYVALRVDIDNWRWARTPFYLRTGKRLARRMTEIAIQFRAVPHSPFSTSGTLPTGESLSVDIEPNWMILRIQPDEGITLRFNAKIPGQSMRIRSVNMDFSYGTAFRADVPEAYERLLLDCMLGDATLFAREDEVEQAWRFCTAILDGWRSHPPDPMYCPNYPSGTWGPREADEFIGRDGRSWRRLS